MEGEQLETMESVKRKKKGNEKMTNSIETAFNQRNFYEAQQLCKTLYFRHFNQQRYKDAEDLLEKSAVRMMLNGQCNESTELALLLLNLFSVTSKPVSRESLDTIMRLSSMYNSDSNEAIIGRENFLKSALKWCSSSAVENKEGISLIHDLLAESYYKQKEFGKAQIHFLRGNKPELFAEMLVKWSLSVLHSERDLLIARAVLQYLCLANIKDANIVFNLFFKNYLELPQSSLINFLRFLLLTVERNAYPLFQMLRQKYKPSLDRDPSFHQYLDHIAKVFFNVKQSSGNFFADFLKTFLSSGQQEEQ